MSLQLDDLALLEAPSEAAGGKPLLLPIDSIDEDPAQPRSEFDLQALQELADTISQRGVRQPISVRPHPETPGRWVLNFGARRLRASKLAGRTDVPAFVDATADSYDQVIENEQRESLKPLELALFVQRRVALGETQTDIARRLGKSQPYIAYACALIDAPDWLLRVYREGKCRGLAELYHLRRLHAQSPDRVEAWASERPVITRVDVQQLKREFTEPGRCSAPATETASVDHHRSTATSEHGVSRTAVSRERTIGRVGLFARMAGDTVEVVVDEAPDAAGQVFIRVPGRATHSPVAAASLDLIGFLPIRDS
jgi:ParB family chromosome partitioning protein